MQSLNVSLLLVLGMTRYDSKVENWRGCTFEKREFWSSGINYNSALFPDISPLHLGPVEWFGASQGAIIAYPIRTFPARIGVSCGLPKGRYLLQASVVFCAKFYLPPYKCCFASMGRVSPCRNRTASHRIRCKLCDELSFAI